MIEKIYELTHIVRYACLTTKLKPTCVGCRQSVVSCRLDHLLMNVILNIIMELETCTWWLVTDMLLCWGRGKWNYRSHQKSIFFSFNCLVIKTDDRPLIFTQFNTPSFKVCLTHALSQSSRCNHSTFLLLFFSVTKIDKNQ